VPVVIILKRPFSLIAARERIVWRFLIACASSSTIISQVTSASSGELHQPYAPSSLEHLRGAGFDYWALGHVHQRQALSHDPPVHYPGNLQGRNPRETGAKGGLLVDLRDPGHPVVEFREFSRLRWERLALDDLADARTLDALVELVVNAWEEARAGDPGSDATEWIVAVDLAGPSPVWRQLREREELETLEQECADCIGALAVEIRADRTHAVVRLEDHIERQDALGASLRLCRRVEAGDDATGHSNPPQDGDQLILTSPLRVTGRRRQVSLHHPHAADAAPHVHHLYCFARREHRRRPGGLPARLRKTLPAIVFQR
jgi:DNA repair exonuclease SbcCD nuclease subunit